MSLAPRPSSASACACGRERPGTRGASRPRTGRSRARGRTGTRSARRARSRAPQASMIAQADASWAGAARSSTSRLPTGSPAGPGRELLDLRRERGRRHRRRSRRARGRPRRRPGRPAARTAPAPRKEGRAAEAPRTPAPRRPWRTAVSERALQLAGDEREHGALDGIPSVTGDRLLVLLLPALDLLDDDQAAAVAGEEAERVHRRDGLVAAGALGRQGLDRLDSEVRSQPLERPTDLRPVAAGQEVDRKELALGHRGQA